MSLRENSNNGTGEAIPVSNSFTFFNANEEHTIASKATSAYS